MQGSGLRTGLSERSIIAALCHGLCDTHMLRCEEKCAAGLDNAIRSHSNTASVQELAALALTAPARTVHLAQVTARAESSSPPSLHLRSVLYLVVLCVRVCVWSQEVFACHPDIAHVTALLCDKRNVTHEDVRVTPGVPVLAMLGTAGDVKVRGAHA
jgi:hypothetical protein